jgi:D-sedoheptulose 7-phosphate isomerase
VSRARIEDGLEALAALARESKALSATVARAAERYVAVLKGGGTIFFCGNGGSAADAQHLAAEYVVRYHTARRALAAIALNTDTSVLTAAGNDLGFDRIFARQLEALARQGDLLVLHSTSGESANLLAAARVARERGVGTVAFLGKGGGRLAGEVEMAIVVPSQQTNQIQSIHLVLEHLIVELVEQQLSGTP